MKVKVYAKLNLTLNVLGKQNGFHVIDSVATSVDVFDVVQVNKRSDMQVTVEGLPNIATAQNTAYKAACGFMRQFDTSGVDIVIEKHIPFGAGMGGSSADAAAVVYCMCSLFDVDVNSTAVHALCAQIGSDVTFMLQGGFGRMRGKGDDVTFGSLGAPLYFALTTFDTSISTAEVYSQYDSINSDVDSVYVDTPALIAALSGGGLNNGIAECFNNHLQAATVGISDYASNYLQFCSKQGLCPNMTGSGSAYYVAFVDEQSANTAASLLNAHGFKTVVCRSVNYGIENI